MKLEQQVVSLELAKKIKSLGVRQGDWESESPLFYWSLYDGGASKDKPEIISCHEANFGFMEDLYAAFTVAELESMLLKKEVRISVCQSGENWSRKKVIWHQHDVFKKYVKEYEKESKTTADAYAELLISLIKMGLIDPKNKKKSGKRSLMKSSPA